MWKEGRNPAEDEPFVSRRRSWTAGETEEALSQVEKAVLDLTECAYIATGKKAHRDELGAGERPDSGVDLPEIVKDFAFCTLRARASTSGSSDDASMTVNFSNEEKAIDKFPDQEEELEMMLHDGTTDEITICFCQTLHTDGTPGALEIRYLHHVDNLRSDLYKIPDEESQNQDHDDPCMLENALHKENSQSYTYLEKPPLSRRQSCPSLFLFRTYSDSIKTYDYTTLLRNEHSEWDRPFFDMPDSISQCPKSCCHSLYNFSSATDRDSSSTHSNLTDAPSHYLETFFHLERLEQKVQRCKAKTRWKTEEAKVKTRVKLEKEWMHGKMGTERLKNRWQKHESRWRDMEVAWRERREGTWGKLRNWVDELIEDLSVYTIPR